MTQEEILQRNEEYRKKFQEAYAGQRDEAINNSNANFDKQKTDVTSQYNNEINSTQNAYEDQYRENAVQKLVNEKQIKENMANMGLTDSGLNRTQQTAAQLSYANNKNDIDITRQKAVDKLSNALASAISTIDINKSNAAASITDSYNQLADKNAQSQVESDINAETERYKAYMSAVSKQQASYEKQQNAAIKEQQKASYIIQTDGGTLSRNFNGSLQDNGISVIQDNDKGTTTYVDNNSGKKTTLKSTVNPFTGDDNSLTSTSFCSNGYQPDNIGGEPLHIAKEDAVTVRGQQQSVWGDGDGNYYVWNGAANRYVQITDSNELDQLGLI